MEAKIHEVSYKLINLNQWGRQPACHSSISYTVFMTGDLEIRKRRLPHWTLAGSTYFLTWRLADGVQPLDPHERLIIKENLLHFNEQRYRLLAYVVMDDHVHVVVKPLAEWKMSKLTHTWKSYTANVINKLRVRRGSLWMDESFDRVIRDENELMQKLEYVLTNPVRRWPDVTDYAWVGWFPEG